MYQNVTVVTNELVIPGYMRMVISCPEMAAAAQCGQFMMLKAWDGNAPFLMRPISINFADPKEGTMTFLYKIVGEGTKLMAALKEGDKMQALGPLGHGFPVSAEAKRVAIIGRGIGIAPLRLLAKTALSQGDGGAEVENGVAHAVIAVPEHCKVGVQLFAAVFADLRAHALYGESDVEKGGEHGVKKAVADEFGAAAVAVLSKGKQEHSFASRG